MRRKNVFTKIIKVQLINNQNCTFISVNHSVKPFSYRNFQVEILLPLFAQEAPA